MFTRAARGTRAGAEAAAVLESDVLRQPPVRRFPCSSCSVSDSDLSQIASWRHLNNPSSANPSCAI